MNRRERRAAWRSVIEDTLDDFMNVPYPAANPVLARRLLKAYWYVRRHSPYDRDWNEWYEEEGDLY